MKNGELIQYKMEFKAVKKIPAPELSKGSVSVTNVKWISNFQYIASYRNLNDDESTRKYKIFQYFGILSFFYLPKRKYDCQSKFESNFYKL